MAGRSLSRATIVLWCSVLAIINGGCWSPPLASQAQDLHPAGPPATLPSQARGTLRVMTWNIRYADKEDPAAALAQIADVIRSHHPDLVALQEVDRRTDRSGGQHQPRRLAELTGMRHAFAPFDDVDDGHVGIAVLSRLPFDAADAIDLPDSATEPNAALRVRVTPAGAPAAVTFVCVHFDHIPAVGGRMAQAKKLVEHLEREAGPVIVAGDFNSTPAEQEVGLMLRHLNPVPKPDSDRFTFSSSAPRREIDYVFYRPAGVLAERGSRVVDGRRASDHRPVVAEFDCAIASHDLDGAGTRPASGTSRPAAR